MSSNPHWSVQMCRCWTQKQAHCRLFGWKLGLRQGMVPSSCLPLTETRWIQFVHSIKWNAKIPEECQPLQRTRQPTEGQLRFYEEELLWRPGRKEKKAADQNRLSNLSCSRVNESFEDWHEDENEQGIQRIDLVGKHREESKTAIQTLCLKNPSWTLKL